MIDEARINELIGLCIQTGQPETFGYMLQQFIDSLQAAQNDLRINSHLKNQEIFHALKGRCGTFGATAIAQAIIEAEHAPPENHHIHLNQILLVISQSIDVLQQLLLVHSQKS